MLPREIHPPQMTLTVPQMTLALPQMTQPAARNPQHPVMIEQMFMQQIRDRDRCTCLHFGVQRPLCIPLREHLREHLRQDLRQDLRQHMPATAR